MLTKIGVEKSQITLKVILMFINQVVEYAPDKRMYLNCLSVSCHKRLLQMTIHVLL